MLSAESSVTIQVEPGEHGFLGRANNRGVIEAGLAPGKHYDGLVRPRMGRAKAAVLMIPVKADSTQAPIDDWLATTWPVTLNPARKEAYLAERLAHVQRALHNVADGYDDFNTLTPEDRR